MTLLPELRARFARLRLRLRGSRDALSLAFLGVVVGACAGLVSIAFRGTIDLWHFLMVPSGGFAASPQQLRFSLPVVGIGLTIGVLYLVGRGPMPMGVVHVLERLARAEGRLPLRNAMVQFIAASLLLGFGMSMGREGPAIHLGAASGSLIGEHLRIAPNALRTLVGCGVAAAIGAAFNTPLAGVILAVEVVLIEYTVGGFTPILLAAVSGATVGRLVYGNAPAFVVPEVMIELTRKGRYAVVTLAIIAGLKLVATAAGVGARLPAGLIGPTLVMGATFGALFGAIGIAMVPAETSNVALYAMLGMAAMMGATLQAPLSALVAVLELTGNPHVILPGILAIVSAALTRQHLFRCESIYASLLLVPPADRRG